MMTDLTKRMIDMQKSTFDMMLNTMSNFQEKSGRATQAYFEQMANLPQEGLKTMNKWMDSMKQTREEFNSIIHENYDEWGNRVEQTMRKTEEAARQAQHDVQEKARQEL
jgi:hypothetical protein